MDVLSEVLQQVRLSGAVLFRASFFDSWCAVVSTESAVVTGVMPATSHLISFHVVLSGQMSAKLADGKELRLKSGEVVVLPHGDSHLIGDSLNRMPVSKWDLFGEQSLPETRDLNWGEGTLRTRILCGYLGCERDAFTPLFAALPRMFKACLGSDAPPPQPLLAFAEQEAVSQLSGAGCSRLRVAELMFVEALRHHMADLPETGSGWLAGLRDPLVGRALGLLHEAPARRWTVESLAQATATSRSRLADRFSSVLGEPPMQYLTRWRMLLAARHLRESRASIASIAEMVGYESSSAFQRVFTRHMGATPAGWRRAGAAGQETSDKSGLPSRPTRPSAPA